MANSHGLRTTGTHTGNFGRPKQKGNPGQLELSAETLNRETCRIPDRDEAFTRLVTAYNTTTDPKLRAGLWEMLKRRKVTLQPINVIAPRKKPASEYWDMVRNTR